MWRDSTEAQLRTEIVRLLRARRPGKTICPSEAARAVAGSEKRTDWEPLMEVARRAIRKLVSEGLIVVTQGGEVVDASVAKGPVRLRLR